jgi:hypothetical protein
MRMNSPPDFKITETPTLHFVANEDEAQLSQDLQTRLEESLRQAEAQPEMTTAVEATRSAEDRLQRMKKAERTLHRCARETNDEMAAATEHALTGVIESASEGEPAFTKLSQLITIEGRIRFMGRALERLVEHLIPLAQIAQLRKDSHELLTRAKAIEKIAQERAERVMGQLREAVSEEMVLPIDMSKGVAGALLAHAGGLKRLALQQAENADRIEKSYTARAAGILKESR